MRTYIIIGGAAVLLAVSSVTAAMAETNCVAAVEAVRGKLAGCFPCEFS